MHVIAKRMAVAGVLAALSVVLLYLAVVLEVSSLFFIAAASFCVGIAIREWGIRYGVVFLVATTLVGVLVLPNKMYCATFTMMGIYLLGSEGLWRMLADSARIKRKNFWFWVGKYMLFNAMYIPVLMLFPKLLFSGKINGLFFVGAILFGQVLLFVYDSAHTYVQATIWNKISKRNL